MKPNIDKAQTQPPSPAGLLRPEQVWRVLTARQQETIFQELTHLCQSLINRQSCETQEMRNED